LVKAVLLAWRASTSARMSEVQRRYVRSAAPQHPPTGTPHRISEQLMVLAALHALVGADVRATGRMMRHPGSIRADGGSRCLAFCGPGYARVSTTTAIQGRKGAAGLGLLDWCHLERRYDPSGALGRDLQWRGALVGLELLQPLRAQRAEVAARALVGMGPHREVLVEDAPDRPEQRGGADANVRSGRRNQLVSQPRDPLR